MQKNTLFNLSWQGYLTLLVALLSAGFFASGVITWIAANWDYFSKFQKLYGVHSLFLITIVLNLFFYYRESKFHNDTSFLSLIFSFLSLVFLGGLFALIGQTYQTGADVWELFAIWSACQIPFLILFPNIGSALLFATTANTTLVLSEHMNGETLDLLLIGLNLILLVLYEFFGANLKDLSWRVLPKLLLISLVSVFIWLVLDYAILSWFICAGLIYYYKERRFDFLNLVILFTYLVISINTRFLWELGDVSGLFLVTVSAFASTIGGIMILTKWFKMHNPSAKKITWHIYPLFIFLMLFCTGLFLAMVVFAFEILDNKHDFIYLSLFILAIAAIMHFSSKDRNDLFEIAIDILSAVGIIIYFVFFLFEFYLTTYFLLMLVLYAIFYFLRTSVWLRFLISVLFLIGMLFYIRYFEGVVYIEEQYLPTQLLFSTPLWMMLFGLGLYYYCVVRTENVLSHLLLPAVWAMLLVGLSLPIIEIFRSTMMFEPVPELPKIDGLGDWFNVITMQFFTEFNQENWLLKILTLLLSILPIIFFILLSQRFELNKTTQVLLFVVIGLLCLGFISANATLSCFALLLLAYLSASRILFTVATLGIIVNLAAYYYWLGVPLLHKAFLLMLLGVIWGVFIFILLRQRQDNELNTVESAVQNRKIFLVKISLTSIVALAISFAAQNKVHTYEDVLNTGEPIILKTAPLDPRSLMQGDYMTLNYEILGDVSNEIELFQTENTEDSEISGILDEKKYFIYALLKRDELGVSTLCRLEIDKPTSFEGCTPNIYLPIKVSHWWPSLPSQDYFFAEGKGEYFAQAEYAEYRFKNGTALLYRLLDKNLKVL